MNIRIASQFASFALIGAIAFGASSAQALSLKECSDKYNLAKTGNALKGKTWNEFRKAECAATPAADTKTAPEAKAPEAKAPEAKKADVKPAPAPAPAAKPATTTTGGKVFPKSVDAKFSSETSAKQRMHTCLEQYKAGKIANTNGGLKWIQKGGGYWSECNKSLKGV